MRALALYCCGNTHTVGDNVTVTKAESSLDILVLIWKSSLLNYLGRDAYIDGTLSKIHVPYLRANCRANSILSN
jgi:hypothetical protein